jgi:hypothetical protein
MWKYAKRKLLIGALKSDYAKRSYDFLPTWLISYFLRLVVDFILYYRLRVPIESTHNLGVYYATNLCVAVVISVGVTMCSPFFYDVVWQYEQHIKKFTNHVADHMSWHYYYIWQTRIFIALSLLAIAVLSWVEVTSMWLIECIVHTLICGFILSKYEELREYLSKPRVVFWEYNDATVHIKTMITVKSACMKVLVRYQSSALIEDYVSPKRAVVINMNAYVQKITLKQKNTLNNFVFNNVQINIFSDYTGKN